MLGHILDVCCLSSACWAAAPSHYISFMGPKNPVVSLQRTETMERLSSNADTQAKHKVPFFHFVYHDQIAPLCPLTSFTHFIWFHGLQPLRICHIHCTFATLLLILSYNKKRTDWIAKVQLIGCDSHAQLVFGCFKTAGNLERNTESEKVPWNWINFHKDPTLLLFCNFPSKPLSFHIDAAKQCSTILQHSTQATNWSYSFF